MEKEDWKTYEKLYTEYQEAQEAYLAAQGMLRGTFSELARYYDTATIDHNRIYEEELAHERFNRARERLHEFLKDKLKKD
jgi:hypothetical protein